jgi:hypothetical protein
LGSISISFILIFLWCWDGALNMLGKSLTTELFLVLQILLGSSSFLLFGYSGNLDPAGHLPITCAKHSGCLVKLPCFQTVWKGGMGKGLVQRAWRAKCLLA